MKDKVIILVQGDLYGPPKTEKSNVLKCVDRKMLKVLILGNSAIRRKLVLAATPRTEFRNMRYTIHQYMMKIFQFLQKKLGITAGYSTFSMQAAYIEKGAACPEGDTSVKVL